MTFGFVVATKIDDDPQSRDPAAATGIVTSFAGLSNPHGAAWADIRCIGITADAATDAAIAFVKYLMHEGYPLHCVRGQFPVAALLEG